MLCVSFFLTDLRSVDCLDVKQDFVGAASTRSSLSVTFVSLGHASRALAVLGPGYGFFNRALENSPRDLKTRSIAGWGSAGAWLVVLRNTVYMPAFLPNSMSLMLFPTMMDF